MTDPLADKVDELRSRLVNLIAEAIEARTGTPGHLADASDLLARYLTDWHSWWEMTNRQARPPCPMHGCNGHAHDSDRSQQVSGNNGGVS